MSRVRLLAGLVLAAVALAALVAGPASAELEFVERTAWLTCPGPTPSQTLNVQYLEAERVGWHDDAPQGSLSEGDGCVQQDYPVGGDAWHLTMEGTFTGNLDSVTLELYALTSHVDPLRRLRFQAVIDDAVGVGQLDDLRPVVHDTDDPSIKRVVVGLDDIGLIDDPEGPGTAEHKVEMQVSGPYYLLDPVSTWLLDAAEAPSNVVFNGDMTGVPTQWDHTFFPRDPHIDDPCYDAEVRTNDTTRQLPHPVAPDLDAVTFATTTGSNGSLTGFDLLIDYCSSVTTVPAGSRTRVAWRAADEAGCDRVHGWIDMAKAAGTDDSFDARYGQTCTIDLDDGGTLTSTRFSEALPANAVIGGPFDTTIHLRSDDLSTEAAATLQEGSVLAAPSALTSADHGLSQASVVNAGDNEASVNTHDVTEDGLDFVLGGG